MQNYIEIHSCSIEKSIMSFPMGALCIKTAINNDSMLPKSVLFEHLLTDNAITSAQECIKRNPIAVGLSTYIWNTEWFETFAMELKKLSPKLIIFAGGPQATSYFENYPDYLSFAVSGEGEITTVNELKSALSGNSSGKVVKGELPNLETLPSVFLTHEADVQLENTDSILWEFTRGCPFKCAFCFESRGNRTVRSYPFEKIKNELTYITNKGIKNVFVLDPTFNLNSNRAKEILNFLIENAPSDMHFTFEVRCELIDEEMASLFAELNCSIQIGLQSSDENVLKTIKRNFNKENFTSKAKLLSNAGVAFGLDLIIGLPSDSLQGFKNSLNYAVSLMPSNIDCFVLNLLPGTVLESQKDEFKLLTYDNNVRTLKSSPTFSEENIKDALSLKKSLDLFYTKGQADMWIHCVLETLNITACNLLMLFSKWMTQTNRTEDEDIWVLQDDFITSLFEKTQNTKLLPAIKSFMELHQGMCFLTDCSDEDSVVLNLWYTPEELSLLDSMSLSEFFKTHKSKHINVTLVREEDNSLRFY